MGLFKKLGLPNADKLDRAVKDSMNPLKNNPITGAGKLVRLARAGKLGRMAVPGETTLMLKPGRLRLTFQETHARGRAGGTSLRSPPACRFAQPGVENRCRSNGSREGPGPEVACAR